MKKNSKYKNLPIDTCYDELDSPIGKLTIVASSQGLHAVSWAFEKQNKPYFFELTTLTKNSKHNIIQCVKKQLNEYFDSKRRVFDIPLALEGTDFQIKAWQTLSKIPFGKTISYGEQAEKLGHKNKARAIGLANGLNPIPIIIPCHRVIGSDGKLTGFTGGLEKKAFLLQHEQKYS